MEEYGGKEDADHGQWWSHGGTLCHHIFHLAAMADVEAMEKWKLTMAITISFHSHRPVERQSHISDSVNSFYKIAFLKL